VWYLTENHIITRCASVTQLLTDKSKDKFMTLLKYTYWRDGEMWLGYLEEYPDYMTQGENMEELQENLKDIYQELVSGTIPSVRHVAELAVA
jgi:predicted RNase H-like HicB family nuclease